MMEIDAQVFELMENPTKTKARDLYVYAILQWFAAIGEDLAGVPEDVWDNPVVVDIAQRHGLFDFNEDDDDEYE